MTSNKKPIFGYWNIRGLGQPIRFLLAYLNVDYEHRVFEYGPEKDENASHAPFRNVQNTIGLDFPELPYWIDDKVRLCQATAIMKHLCRNYSGRSLLAPSEDMETQYEMVESLILSDVWANIRDFSFGCITEDRLITINKIRLQRLSDYLGNKKWIMGELSYVDFFLYEVLLRHKVYNASWITPNLQNYLERFEALPAIATNLKTSPFVKKCFSAPNAKVILMPPN